MTDQVTIKGKSLVSSAELTAKAFSQGILGQYGGKLVAIALLLFAFSTSITCAIMVIDQQPIYLVKKASFGIEIFMFYALF